MTPGRRERGGDSHRGLSPSATLVTRDRHGMGEAVGVSAGLADRAERPGSGRSPPALREDVPAPAATCPLRRAHAARWDRDVDLRLLKGMSPAWSSDPALHERVFAVLADGLRAPR